MPPIDYPGARQRLYAVRALRHQDRALIGAGWEPGTFLGVYRDYTAEAAILTARSDRPQAFIDGPVICGDLSSFLRLVSGEVAASVWVVLYPDGEMERGMTGPGAPVVLAAQATQRLYKVA